MDFVKRINMEEIQYQRRQWTWANNWKDVEARLDRFFRSSQLLVTHEKRVVKHMERQASDHCILVVDTNPEKVRTKRRFYFDKRWIDKPGVEEIIKKTWELECIGSPMFKVACKIKR